MQVMIVCTLACSCLFAQDPQLRTRNGAAFATVVFTRALSTATPRFFSIAIDSTGSTTYQSAPASLQQTGNPYNVDFAASADVREKIFHLVGQLHFFQVPENALQQPTANQAVNTLTFREGTVANQITFYDSTNSQIRDLALLFESISETLEFSRQLTRLHSTHDPQLGPELDHMLELTKRNRLSELFVVSPVLQQIVSDQAELEEIRKKAKEILEYDSRQL